MNRNKKIIIIVATIVFLGGVGFWYYLNNYKNKSLQTFTPISKNTEPTKQEIKVPCALDGFPTTETTANRHPLAIMVENHIDARPQSGLSEASLIYEAIAEGGITRFMAIYSCNDVEKVGPVRSARTYYIDWLSEFNAFYAHVGGNYDALEKIKADKILDLDQFRYGGQAYWRESGTGKAIEHTMYTKTQKLWDIAAKNKWDMEGKYENFEFKDDLEKSQRTTTSSLIINFSTPNYQVKWIYDPETNLYIRNQTKGPEIKAKNIIVQWVERWPVTTKINEVGYAMKTVGSGKTKIYIDGKVIEGTWKKESKTARTWFYDSSGEKIKLNRGQIWVEIVHNDISVQ